MLELEPLLDAFQDPHKNQLPKLRVYLFRPKIFFFSEQLLYIGLCSRPRKFYLNKEEKTPAVMETGEKDNNPINFNKEKNISETNKCSEKKYVRVMEQRELPPDFSSGG